MAMTPEDLAAAKKALEDAGVDIPPEGRLLIGPDGKKYLIKRALPTLHDMFGVERDPTAPRLRNRKRRRHKKKRRVQVRS